MHHWTEIKTAATVARLGTISAAADKLGVHRATITRHIDVLEQELGAKLFQRHGRGFTPTELGHELLRIANVTEDQFAQLTRLAQNQSVDISGELVITSLEIMAPRIMPYIDEFIRRNPAVAVRFRSTATLMKLEYGEAHIAIRAGAKPQEHDNVVRHFIRVKQGLYAAQSYVEQYGLPNDPNDFANHNFIGSDDDTPRATFLRWLHDHIPHDCFIMRCNTPFAHQTAVRAGLGIGFLPIDNAGDDMIQIAPHRPEWDTDLWLVTHMDLHRSPKVQAFLDVVKNFKP